MFMLVLMLCLC